MNWLYKVEEFNKFLSKDPTLEQAKEGIPRILRSNVAFKGLSPLIADGLEKAKSVDDFDDLLAEVYDFADRKRIWLGI